jgi:hypothetical protein
LQFGPNESELEKPVTSETEKPRGQNSKFKDKQLTKKEKLGKSKQKENASNCRI